MKIKKTIGLSIATGILGLGVASTAQASAYAVSFLNITDLIITTTPAVAILPGTPLSRADAGLNGAATASVTLLDAAAVNAPGSNPAVVRLNNVFNQFGQVSPSYSNSDAVIDSQQTSGAVFTQTRGISEAFVDGNAFATGGSAENNSATGFILSVAGGPVTFTFDFNAAKYLQAALSGDAFVPGSSATATINASVTINDSVGTTYFGWSPDGAVTAGGVTGIAGGSETADAFNLNQTVTSLFPGTSPTSNSGGCMIAAMNSFGTGVGNPCFGHFAASVTLAPGIYNLGLAGKDSVTVSSVPAPGILALLGIGLAGLGFANRKKAKA